MRQVCSVLAIVGALGATKAPAQSVDQNFPEVWANFLSVCGQVLFGDLDAIVTAPVRVPGYDRVSLLAGPGNFEVIYNQSSADYARTVFFETYRSATRHSAECQSSWFFLDGGVDVAQSITDLTAQLAAAPHITAVTGPLTTLVQMGDDDTANDAQSSVSILLSGVFAARDVNVILTVDETGFSAYAHDSWVLQ